MKPQDFTFSFLLPLATAAVAPASPPKYSVILPARRDSADCREAEVHFAGKTRRRAVLKDGTGGASWLWAPLISVSPDRRWILLVQKIGAGYNTAFVYHVSDAGNVRRLKTPLDTLAWRYSDKVSPLKRNRLYHTGISDWVWTRRGTLTFTLSGSEYDVSGSGVRLRLEYRPVKNTLTRV